MPSLRLSRIALFPLVSLAGCMINVVHPLSPASVAKSNGAVLVYGVQVEGQRNASHLNVQLDEYDLAKQTGAGNCFTFNRAEAIVSSSPGALAYFAFEVPAGLYTYSAFNGARLAGETLAFTAVQGRVSYAGDFVYTSAGTVELRRDSEAFASKLPHAFPGTKGKFVLAGAVPVHAPHLFMCAP